MNKKRKNAGKSRGKSDVNKEGLDIEIEDRTRKKPKIYKLLENEEFLRALKEKLAAI